MSNRSLVLAVLLLGSLVAGLALFWHPAPPERPLPTPGLPAGGDFTLQSVDGQVSLTDFRGKVVLVYFGYTFCPDICPTALITVADAIEQLEPDEQERLAVIFVSVDPARDTPERLREYADFFHPKIVGVTGSEEEVRDIAQAYGAFYAIPADMEGGGYVVDHSADIYVVSRDGRVVEKLVHGTIATKMAQAVRTALRD
jgi:protein SCO1/2